MFSALPFMAVAPPKIELAEPFLVTAGGKVIEVEVGHAAPILVDFNGNGRNDLLVGQFGQGRLRVYPNVILTLLVSFIVLTLLVSCTRLGSSGGRDSLSFEEALGGRHWTNGIASELPQLEGGFKRQAQLKLDDLRKEIEAYLDPPEGLTPREAYQRQINVAVLNRLLFNEQLGKLEGVWFGPDWPLQGPVWKRVDGELHLQHFDDPLITTAAGYAALEEFDRLRAIAEKSLSFEEALGGRQWTNGIASELPQLEAGFKRLAQLKLDDLRKEIQTYLGPPEGLTPPEAYPRQINVAVLNRLLFNEQLGKLKGVWFGPDQALQRPAWKRVDGELHLQLFAEPLYGTAAGYAALEEFDRLRAIAEKRGRKSEH